MTMGFNEGKNCANGPLTVILTQGIQGGATRCLTFLVHQRKLTVGERTISFMTRSVRSYNYRD